MDVNKLKKSIKNEIISILSEADQKDLQGQKDINKELEKSIDSLETIEDLTTSEAVKLGEDEEEEPTSSQLKGASKDSIAVLARKLQQVSSELKSTANKWKRSEGGEKEELKNRLLTLTSIKKELESMLE
jgi:hypothetical protein